MYFVYNNQNANLVRIGKQQKDDPRYSNVIYCKTLKKAEKIALQLAKENYFFQLWSLELTVKDLKLEYENN